MLTMNRIMLSIVQEQLHTAVHKIETISVVQIASR